MSFKLSSSPSSQVDVTATGTGTSVVIGGVSDPAGTIGHFRNDYRDDCSYASGCIRYNQEDGSTSALTVYNLLTGK